MSFAAPLFAWVAAGAVLATIALHLLAWRRPPATPLPTARFAPEEPVRTVSRAIRPADLPLLALRVVLLSLVGLALAGPTLTSKRQGKASVVLFDRTFGAPLGATIADSARATFRAGDALVVFDSTAREIPNATRDSIVAGTRAVGGGPISAALVAGVRAAKRLKREHESVEIAIVSPFATNELDAASATIRRMWDGPIRLVRAGAPPNEVSLPGRPVVRAETGDGVAAALSLTGAYADGADVRVIRDAPVADDSAWARAGHTLVVWPATPSASRMEGRSPPDTVYAVSAMGGAIRSDRDAMPATVVAPFIRTVAPPPGTVVARWSDGDPAVTESALGAGCVRSLAVALPATGDLPLTPAFRRFAERMAQRCDGLGRWTALSDSAIAAALPASVAPTSKVPPTVAGAPSPVSKLTAWLLALALLAAVAELLVRRGSAHATA